MSIQKNISEIIEKINSYKLDMVKIKPSAKPPKHPWSSKFGGKPYWPIGKEYPSTKEGSPLFLLAQINFEEMPSLAGYPTKGILQFFIANDDVYGLDFDTPLEETIKKPNGYRVIYHAEVLSEIESELPMASDDCYLPLSAESSLSFILAKELPSPTDYRFEQIVGDTLDLDEEVCEYLYDHLDASGSKVGGYANFTQEDPRSYEKTDENWLLLFQMDTEDSDGVDIMWGDCGVGNFFIKPESLSKCDFSNVWYNWDCC